MNVMTMRFVMSFNHLHHHLSWVLTPPPPLLCPPLVLTPTLVLVPVQWMVSKRQESSGGMVEWQWEAGVGWRGSSCFSNGWCGAVSVQVHPTTIYFSTLAFSTLSFNGGGPQSVTDWVLGDLGCLWPLVTGAENSGREARLAHCSYISNSKPYEWLLK